MCESLHALLPSFRVVVLTLFLHYRPGGPFPAFDVPNPPSPPTPLIMTLVRWVHDQGMVCHQDYIIVIVRCDDDDVVMHSCLLHSQFPLSSEIVQPYLHPHESRRLIQYIFGCPLHRYQEGCLFCLPPNEPGRCSGSFG